MIYIVSEDVEQLKTLNERITLGLKAQDESFNANSYSEILQGENCYALPLDENDLRDPLQFLTEDEINLKVDFFEVNNGN